MATFNLPRLFAPVMLAAALGVAALMPGKAQASDNLVRELVDVADVIYHSGQPYYRDGNYGRYDRVVIVRDRYHRPDYYRYVPREHRVVYRNGPPYGYAHGHYRERPRYYYRHDRYSDRYDRRQDHGKHGHGKKDKHRRRWDN